MAGPLVRARLLSQWLQMVEAEADPYRRRFREGVPAELRARIAAAGRFDWLPMGLHAQLADVLLEAFGPARAHDYYRRAMVQSVRGPVLGPLFRTGSRLLGLTPAAFLRWAGHGWRSSFKDGGSLRGELVGPGRGQLIYEGMPAECTRSKAWVESSMGSAYGVYDLTEVQGVVRLDESRLAEGAFSLTLEWTEPSGRAQGSASRIRTSSTSAPPPALDGTDAEEGD